MKRPLVAVVLASAIAACATQTAKQEPASSVAAPPPAAASAPSVAPETPVANGATATPPTAQPGSASSATVIFYRPSKFVGGAVSFKVREDKQELGKLASGKYFTIQVSPGKHTYTVHSEAADNLTIDADPGMTYYIEGEIGMGVLVGHPHLKPSDQSTFDGVKSKLVEVPAIAG